MLRNLLLIKDVKRDNAQLKVHDVKTITLSVEHNFSYYIDFQKRKSLAIDMGFQCTTIFEYHLKKFQWLNVLMVGGPKPTREPR